MNDLKLNITAEGSNPATITLSASFDSADQAIAFHEKLATLCRETSAPQTSPKVLLSFRQLVSGNG